MGFNTLRKFFLFSILLLFLVNLISADLRVVLLTPKEVIRGNYSDIYKSQVKILNSNNETIGIEMDMPKDILLASNSPYSFQLLPNETKIINYSILINRTGNYSSFINVVYKKEKISFSMQELLIFNIPCITGILCEDYADNIDIVNDTINKNEDEGGRDLINENQEKMEKLIKDFENSNNNFSYRTNGSIEIKVNDKQKTFWDTFLLLCILAGLIIALILISLRIFIKVKNKLNKGDDDDSKP